MSGNFQNLSTGNFQTHNHCCNTVIENYLIKESFVELSAWPVWRSQNPSLTFFLINVLSILVLLTARLWYSLFAMLYNHKDIK